MLYLIEELSMKSYIKIAPGQEILEWLKEWADSNGCSVEAQAITTLRAAKTFLEGAHPNDNGTNTPDN
jgi:hypothetical protein